MDGGKGVRVRGGGSREKHIAMGATSPTSISLYPLLSYQYHLKPLRRRMTNELCNVLGNADKGTERSWTTNIVLIINED